MRGHSKDSDGWRDAGCPGWGYADVLPYFKRMETNWRGAGPFHGGSGPVRISRMEGPEMLWEPLLASARAAGIPHCEDANGAEQDGISQMDSTVWGGLRTSSARAYLYPVMGRANLHIETGALVSRIVLQGQRATGVEYRKDGNLQTAQAGREVLLCGGAFNSPQLLMLSGIGPADELRAVGVTPVQDLPGVGRNLSDHPNILNEYELRGEEGLTRYMRLDRTTVAIARWFLGKRGPFAYTGVAANVFARTLEGLDQPDIQMMCLPISNGANLWVPGFQKKPEFRLAVRTGYLQPKSRGWVKLRSADPADHPRILLNLFNDPADLDAMVRAIHLSRSLYSQSPLRDLIKREALPGPGTDDVEGLKEHIRRNAGHRSHPVGTCKMGLGEDAVVDAQLRVRGIEGLRVADASIMPTIPSGNTNLPCMMVGERAADLVLGRSLPPEA